MGMNDLSDEEIVLKLQEFSRLDESFEAAAHQYASVLYNRYYKQAYKLCRYYGLSHNDAQDTAQDAFLKFFRHAGSFRSGSQFKPWFLKLVHNKVKDRWQELSRHRPSDISELEEKPDQNKENLCETFPETDHIRGIIMKLKPKLREVLMLKIRDDMSSEEIGAAVGLSERQVRNRIAEAYDEVKRMLEQDYE